MQASIQKTLCKSMRKTGRDVVDLASKKIEIVKPGSPKYFQNQSGVAFYRNWDFKEQLIACWRFESTQRN